MGNGKHAVSYPIKDKAFINFVFCINTENFYEQDWTREVDTSDLIKNFSDFITFEGVFEKIASLKNGDYLNIPLINHGTIIVSFCWVTLVTQYYHILLRVHLKQLRTLMYYANP